MPNRELMGSIPEKSACFMVNVGSLRVESSLGTVEERQDFVVNAVLTTLGQCVDLYVYTCSSYGTGTAATESASHWLSDALLWWLRALMGGDQNV